MGVSSPLRIAVGAFSRGEERREVDVPDQAGQGRAAGLAWRRESGRGDFSPNSG